MAATMTAATTTAVESKASPGQRLKLPPPTRDVEQGKRDLDEYGLCVHEAFVEAEQVKR